MKNNEENIDSLFNKVAAATLKSYRTNYGLSLEDIVKKMIIPITRQSLFNYENNIARIKNNIFIDICRVLKLNPNEIFQEICLSVMTIVEQLKMDEEENISNIISVTNEQTNIINLRISTNNPLYELDQLFDKNKELLTQDDIEFIEFIIKKRINNIEENMKGNN